MPIPVHRKEVRHMSNADLEDGDDVDTERTCVQTYVPAYQREIWTDHADELEMSRSEFIRSMVQAGRRGFHTGPDDDGERAPGEGDAGDERLPAVVRDRVAAVLGQVEYVQHEELHALLVEDITQALGAALDDLQDDDTVRHQRDGYTLVDGGDRVE